MTLPTRTEVESAIAALRSARVNEIRGLDVEIVVVAAADADGCAPLFARALLVLAAEPLRDRQRIAALPNGEVTLAAYREVLLADAGSAISAPGKTIHAALADLEAALADAADAARDCPMCGGAVGDPPCRACRGTGLARGEDRDDG